MAYLIGLKLSEMSDLSLLECRSLIKKFLFEFEFWHLVNSGLKSLFGDDFKIIGGGLEIE